MFPQRWGFIKIATNNKIEDRIGYLSWTVSKMTIAIETPSKEKIVKFCRSHHIHKLSIFGSALRKDFGPESDIDILVEFEPGHVPGFFGLIKIQDELSELFGHRVDLRTPMDLSRYFRERVLREAEVQYVAE